MKGGAPPPSHYLLKAPFYSSNRTDDAHGAGPDQDSLTRVLLLRNVLPIPLAWLLVGFLQELPQVLIGVSVSTVSRVQISIWGT